MFSYIGNMQLLHKQKIGFLASRKISTVSVLPTLDWAMEISQHIEVAVVSGFQSYIEKEVLKILLRGKCGIIVILARSMYRQVPKLYEDALRKNRLLLLSYEKDSVTRVSEWTAHQRNKKVESISDKIISFSHQINEDDSTGYE